MMANSGKNEARFTSRAGKRIARAVVEVEGRYLGENQSGSPWGRGCPPAFIVQGVVTSAIPTGSVDAPSTSGQVTVHSYDPDAGTSGAETHSEFVNMQVFNRHTLSASIATGKVVTLALIDGVYWLIGADCP